MIEKIRKLLDENYDLTTNIINKMIISNILFQNINFEFYLNLARFFI